MKKKIWFVAALVFLIFLIITNVFMNVTPPFKVDQSNIWIGFFATYFGATFGGILSGLFTYLGVKHTIEDQRNSNEEKLRRENRPFLQLGEIYEAVLNLASHFLFQKQNGFKNFFNVDHDFLNEEINWSIPKKSRSNKISINLISLLIIFNFMEYLSALGLALPLSFFL